MHIDVGICVLGPQRLQLGGHLLIVKSFPPRRTCLVLQLELNQRTVQIVAHESPDLARLFRVGPDRRDVLRRAAEARADHAASGKALFGDLHVAHPGRPQGRHGFTLDAVNEEHIICHGLEAFQKAAVEDVALFADQRHHDRVSATEGGFVVQERLHELMVARNRFVESRVHMQPGG